MATGGCISCCNGKAGAPITRRFSGFTAKKGCRSEPETPAGGAPAGIGLGGQRQPG